MVFGEGRKSIIVEAKVTGERKSDGSRHRQNRSKG
jgi:hypothetical protein